MNCLLQEVQLRIDQMLCTNERECNFVAKCFLFDLKTITKDRVVKKGRGTAQPTVHTPVHTEGLNLQSFDTEHNLHDEQPDFGGVLQ